MKYLALDTSGKRLLIIAKNGEKSAVYDDPECGIRHSVEIMNAIEETAGKVFSNLAEADFFACTVGAGSFTGIRIGVSTIKALAFAYGKPCVSITSFDALAYNKREGKYISVIDALHDAFYVCGYDDLKVVIPPSYVTREKLLEYAKEYILLSEKPLAGLPTETADFREGFIKAVEEKSDDKISPESLDPLYVKKSQAEEEAK